MSANIHTRMERDPLNCRYLIFPLLNEKQWIFVVVLNRMYLTQSIVVDTSLKMEKGFSRNYEKKIMEYIEDIEEFINVSLVHFQPDFKKKKELAKPKIPFLDEQVFIVNLKLSEPGSAYYCIGLINWFIQNPPRAWTEWVFI